MRRWSVFITVVLVTSVAAVCVETVAMAVWGKLQFDGWQTRTLGNHPPWTNGDNGIWPVDPSRKSASHGLVIDGAGYGAWKYGRYSSAADELYLLYNFRVGWPCRCGSYEYQAE